MALVISREEPSGISSNYHRVIGVNWFPGRLMISIASYKDETARRSSKEMISQRSYIIENFDVDQPLFSQVYSALKAMSEYSGAQDA